MDGSIIPYPASAGSGGGEGLFRDPHPSQHACADCLGELREAAGGCAGETLPSDGCTVGPASGQEEGGLEEVTDAVILLSSA